MEAGGRQRNKRGLWNEEEDKILMEYIEVHGKGQWNRIAKKTGLKRCGKSCRLRWVNYLSPNVNRGDFTEEEEDLIIRLHKLLGNRWSLIAGRVPGRTDNQVKNYWNTHLSKRNGSVKRRKTESFYATNPETKSVSCKYSETVTTRSLASLSPLGTHTVIAAAETSNMEMENNLIGDTAPFPDNAFCGLADEQISSSYQSLDQFSDEFFQFDFGWSSSLFTD